jgi:hypothetical protein
MQKEFKDFKEGCRYLVTESLYYRKELIEVKILEISDKAIKVDFGKNSVIWFLKDDFYYKMLEELPIVREEKLKLEWQENPSEKPMNWYEAIKYADLLGEGWRLPTKEELKEAYDSKIEGFKKSLAYWSLEEYVQNTIYAWLVNFYNRYVFYGGKTNTYYVRCVRDELNRN